MPTYPKRSICVREEKSHLHIVARKIWLQWIRIATRNCYLSFMVRDEPIKKRTKCEIAFNDGKKAKNISKVLDPSKFELRSLFLNGMCKDRGEVVG